MLGILFFYYGDGSFLFSLLDAFVFILFFSVPSYFSWYMLGFFDRLYKQIGILALVIFLCLSANQMLFSLLSPESNEWFLRSIPLRIIGLLLAWTILFLWYREYLFYQSEPTEQDVELDIESESDEEFRNMHATDRISVKNGTKIHLIAPSELVYVQASGDYVTLFTIDKQFVKEQTMKSFIVQLPPNFVRIHRSTIVNCDFIARIELYEKQSYRLRLKNGTYLKISSGGYKLLKEQLSL